MYSPQKRQVGSAFALTYRLRLRSCKLLDAFVISSLPPMLLEPLQNSRAPSLHGHYSASPLLRARPSPSRLPLISRVYAGYTGSCSADFATGRGGLLHLLGVSLSSCCRYVPRQSVPPHQSVATFHAAFALRTGARPLR